jgi:N-acyl-D-aspartate/D-glutamate deacylase/CubicO group peptidase (beta-lactamase class C family)
VRVLTFGVALAGALLSVACVQTRAGREEPDAASVLVDELVARDEQRAVPGAAAIVVRDGTIVKRLAWGLADLERGVPIETDSAFRLASVSKQFTAMAIMMLAEEGRLDYEDPIVRFLPELARFGEDVHVRHLLTHTAGLPDYYDVMVQVAGVERPHTRHALDVFSRWGEPRFAPGERYEYSNPGYELLALIVERASGRRYAEFLEQRIFAPLGMKDTVVFDERAPQIPKRAHGYRREGEGFALDDDDPLNYLVGSGGIYSSPEDLVRWDRALYGERLVRAETLAEAFRPTRLKGGEEYPYGFGWSLERHLGRRRVSHTGSWLGFRTAIARYPDDGLSVIVLANFAEMDAEGLAGAIAAAYLDAPTVIVGASLLDGTGAPARPASVRILADRVIGVGELEPRPGERVVDASGLALAPGFIDTHSHADAELFGHPDALAALSQGITTAIVGQDGDSPPSLDAFFSRIEREGVAINVASYAGFGTLRRRVLGDDFRRPATADEIQRMRALLRDELAAGALGLGTGLEYEPDRYGPTSEVVALARETALHGGRYVSHIRSEDRQFWQAIEEILEIGRRAGIPVQISHLKLAQQSLLGRAERLLEILDAARAEGVDVTADLYPYPYWESTLSVFFPDRDFENLESAAYALSEVTTPERARLSRYDPDPRYVGRTLREIAQLRGIDPAAALVELAREAEAYREATGEDEVESVVATSMDERDIERLLRWPHTNLCTDGSLRGTHPRGFGSYPRVLGRYVRERGVVELAAAVHKASGLAAAHVGIRDRGTVARGKAADLVLFDPGSVLDRATPERPQEPSVGIRRVWVNGEVVYEGGRSTGRRPGRAIRRSLAEPAWEAAALLAGG